MQFITLAVAFAFSTGVTSLPVSTRAVKDDPSPSTEASVGAAAPLKAVTTPVTLMAITSSTSINTKTDAAASAGGPSGSNDNLPAEDSASADLSEDDVGDMSSSGAAGSTIVGPSPTGSTGSGSPGSASGAVSGPSPGPSGPAPTVSSGSAPSDTSMDASDFPANGLPSQSGVGQSPMTGLSGPLFAHSTGPSGSSSDGQSDSGPSIQFQPPPPPMSSLSPGFRPQFHGPEGPSHVSAFPFPPAGHPSPQFPYGYPQPFGTPAEDFCLPSFVHSYPAGFAPFYPAGGFPYPSAFGPSI
ncbi:hypothetical protein PGT21_024143 [Puccinia graminis f. sp. tritici]|uniref:Uncharacterized protein n=1 Tax=Puccinia graminis f. sp. tritici TaxID=56615 RepID=A0A5B0MS42_PUCGR|nr:hypothetical protein PGT21_024143 [Puccinia graminis f. sp. tritici]